MIFTISGMPRSGTTMMMKAMHAGGIPVPEVTLDNEFMELPRTQFDAGIDTFYDGKLVKIFANRLDVLRDSAEYKVLYMLRDPEDILDSYWTKFPMGVPGVDFPKEKGLVHQLQVYSFKAWMDRPNVEILPIDYDEITSHPDVFMEAIQRRGWPIKTGMAERSIRLGNTKLITSIGH